MLFNGKYFSLYWIKWMFLWSGWKLTLDSLKRNYNTMNPPLPPWVERSLPDRAAYFLALPLLEQIIQWECVGSLNIPAKEFVFSTSYSGWRLKLTFLSCAHSRESHRKNWGVYVFLNSEGLTPKFLMEDVTYKKKVDEGLYFDEDLWK